MKHRDKRHLRTRGQKVQVSTGLVAGLMTVSLGVTGMVATAPNAAAGSTKTVVFWEYNTDTPSINAWKASIKRFEAANPGITVQMEIVPWSEQEEKLTTAIATGGEPDVSMLGDDVVAQYVAEKQLLPVTLPENGKEVLKQDWSYYHLNGQWWGVPILDETWAYLYNKAIFKAAGISSTPENFGQLLADAQEIKAKTGKIAILLDMAENSYDTVQQFMSFYLGYGARFLTPGDACGFNTPQFKAALTYYTNFYKDGLDTPDATTDQSTQLESDFTAGKAAMILDGSAYAYALKVANPKLFAETGYFEPPSGPAGRFAFGAGWPLVVWRQAASSGVANAAKAFAEFEGGPNGAATALNREGTDPGNLETIQEPFWNTGYMKTFTQTLIKYGVPYQYPMPEIPQMGELEVNTVQTAVESVATGSATVDQATSTLCASINKVMGK